MKTIYQENIIIYNMLILKPSFMKPVYVEFLIWNTKLKVL